MNQDQQRRVQTIRIYYNTAEKYKQPTQAETGSRLKYDIKELRIHPGKLTQPYQKLGQESETENPRGRNMTGGNGKTTREH